MPIDTLKIPSELIETVSVVKNSKNLGYAPAICKHAHLLKGDFLLFLNPDVSPGDWMWLVDLLKFMCNNDDVGVVSPVIYNDRGEAFLGGTFNPFIPTIKPWKKIPVTKVRLLASKRLTLPYVWVTGAVLLTRTDLFRKIGGFDSRFIFYYNEVDYCLRVWLSEYKVYLLTWAMLKNIGGVSFKRSEKVWKLALLNYFDLKELLYMDRKFLGACVHYIYYVASHLLMMAIFRPILHSLRYRSALPYFYSFLAIKNFIKEHGFKERPIVNGCYAFKLIKTINARRKATISGIVNDGNDI
jgi:GT2 family glycosyltransferase